MKKVSGLIKKDDSKNEQESLPKSITGHPYFHPMKENEAKEWLSEYRGTGNCLFCLSGKEQKSDSAKEYIFLYKSITDSQIKDVQFTYYKTKLASRGCEVTDFGVTVSMEDFAYSANLYEAIEFIPHICSKIKPDYLLPILNPVAQEQIKRVPLTNEILAPLPNEIIKLIFEYLDFKSIIETSRVSKGLNGFFSANLHETIKMHHQETRNKVNEHTKKMEEESGKNNFCINYLPMRNTQGIE